MFVHIFKLNQIKLINSNKAKERKREREEYSTLGGFLFGFTMSEKNRKESAG